jgi:hypothetical protein
MHAGGDQLDGGRIHRVNRALEAAQQTLALATAGEARVQALEMFEHGPEELLGHRGVAMLVGVGEIVPRGCRRSAQGRQRTRVQTQRITDVIEPNGMGELCVNQRDHMTPRRERPRFLIHLSRTRQFGHEKLRDGVANLAQNRVQMRRWRRGFGFFHPAVGRKSNPVPTLFFVSLWDGCV